MYQAVAERVVYRKDPLSDNDGFFVRETQYHDDGRVLFVPKWLPNLPVDAYITQKTKRKHRQKKEFEHLDNLVKVSSTPARLDSAIAKPLAIRNANYISASPYVYGYSICPTAKLKYKYHLKYPKARTTHKRVAAFDIETSMADGSIIISGFSFKNIAVIGIVRSFVSKLAFTDEDRERMTRDALEAQLGDVLRKRNIKVELVWCDTPAQTFLACIKRMHELQPDFISVWNIAFDLPVCIKALKDEGYDLGDVFSDPVVPREYRHCEYVAGDTTKIKNGKPMSLHPADVWNYMDAPSGFMWIDSMFIYRNLRLAAGMETSYKLDHILTKVLGHGKLKCDVPGDGGEQWHITMQKDHPFEYIAYNLYDCIGLEELDEVTQDLSVSLPIFCGFMPIETYHRSTARTENKLYFHALAKDQVIGCVGFKSADEFEERLPARTDWIAILQSALIGIPGVPIFNDLDTPNSRVFLHNSDFDITGTYPNIQTLLNISKSTMEMETMQLLDTNYYDRRYYGSALLGGTTNAYQVSRRLFEAPSFEELLAGFVN